MAQLVWVQPGRDDGRVALYEQHRDHPDGEAWVATTGQPVQVARTPLVERKLAAGDLVEVAAPKPAGKATPPRKSKAEIDAEIAAAQGRAAPPTGSPLGAPASPLAGLGLSAEQEAALTAAGLPDRDALAAASDDDLITIPTIGEATVAQLRKALAQAGA